ncbi:MULTISPECIES: ParA family protein [Anoxynatronum]|uniref:Sporulation initiation inhibitor protein Soj n=2 Tax=Anoxynatronum TaxID=210622 RepID=A0AA45WXC2_9CLOT|nr:AAA family ATPase [Anoxynatronum buryatiense]SMP58414.1 chromosome partitioning protein [Anoxynatronum buryatiense]
MGVSIAVFNQKGGVGKTTMAVNLSACLAAQGKKVCVLDIDPQGNATSGFGIDKSQLTTTIYDALVNEIDIEKVIIPSGYENLDVIPASVDLAGAEIELTAQKQRERVLRKALETIKEKYDYIFVDCPPSLGLLTINSLAAVDRILIPIQCEYYALEGVSHLMNTYQMVKNNLNPALTIQGVVLMMFDGRTNLSIQVVEQVKRVFRGKVYRTIVPRNIRLAEAPSHGEPIIYYDARSKGAEAYRELAEEFIELEEGDW